MIQTQRDFEDPTATQLSVFLQNRIGQLRDLLRELEAAQVKLLAISVHDSSDFAIVRLVVDKSETARLALERNGHSLSVSRVLVVCLPDDESGLQNLARVLLCGEVNIHHVYPLLRRPHGKCAVVIHPDDATTAADLLQKDGFLVIADEELGS